MLLGAAIINSEIKWELYYAAAVGRIFAGGATIALGCRHAMKIKDSWITSTFLFCAGMSFLVWTFSPFAWYLCEGRQAISVDEEIIMYSVLDLIAKPIVCTLILQMHSAIDPTTIGMKVYTYDGQSSVAIDAPAEED
jgi:bacteriorhodopsin